MVHLGVYMSDQENQTDAPGASAEGPAGGAPAADEATELLTPEGHSAGSDETLDGGSSGSFRFSPTPATEALSARYDIQEQLGKGGMGIVYKALDRETGDTVALKILRPEVANDPDIQARFKNELRLARKITHKNVCRIYEYSRAGDTAYISMEFVAGETLRRVLERFGGLPLRKGVELGRQICAGLHEAHEQGVVHRDLKPDNVMVDEAGNVKLMDFGIARSAEGNATLTGQAIGTPAYMAPEQVEGKPVDARTDLYALGLILYEMFTGTQAFRGDTPLAVALKQVREQPTPPRQIEATLPLPLERIILRCLNKDANLRFPSVNTLDTALAEVAEKHRTGTLPADPAVAAPSAETTPTHTPAVRPASQSATTETESGSAGGGRPLRWAALVAVAFVVLFLLQRNSQNSEPATTPANSPASVQAGTQAGAVPPVPSAPVASPTPVQQPATARQTTPRQNSPPSVQPQRPQQTGRPLASQDTRAQTDSRRRIQGQREGTRNLYRRARQAIRQGNFEEAAEQFEEILRQNPDNRQARDAVENLRRMQEAKSNPQLREHLVSQLLERADQLARQGTRENAAMLYEAVLALDRGNTRARRGLSTLRRRRTR